MKSRVTFVGTGVLIGLVIGLGFYFYGTDAPQYTQTPVEPGGVQVTVDADGKPNGKYFKYRTHRFDEDLTDEQREQMKQLEAIGYADGSVAGDGRGHVTVHDRERAAAGYNFYCSGHGPEAVLMDMDGNEIHRWHHEFWETFPEYPLTEYHGGTNNFRRVMLLEGGDVIAIHEGLAAVRFDKDNKTKWSNPGRAHHDLDVHENGDLYLLTREAKMIYRLDLTQALLEDFVSIVDIDTGTEKRRISLIEALEKSQWADWLKERSDRSDVFHTNTLSILDGTASHPAFKAGNVLLSLRNMNMLAVLDVHEGLFVWAHRGDYNIQHEPSITAAGDLLLFDNMGGRRGRKTRISLYEIPGMKARWHWNGGDVPLRSATLGTAAELANGNLLVTESERGRAVEVTADDREVVWEFINPHTAGPNDEFIAAMFEMSRLPADFDVSWAKGSPTPAMQTRVQPFERK